MDSPDERSPTVPILRGMGTGAGSVQPTVGAPQGKAKGILSYVGHTVSLSV
jgi:hypothetical protein